MNFLNLLLFTLCQTTPPAITTPDNAPNDSVYGIISILIIIILSILVIALICYVIALSREIKKLKKSSNTTEEHLKLISEFNKLSDEEKETALKMLQGLNSKNWIPTKNC